MSSQTRETFLAALSATINSIKSSHPLRIAIDGVDTSGKTTLADELAESLKQYDRPIIRVSIDKFHRPKTDRYKKGVDSPEGYYEDSFNHELLVSRLLQPIGENKPFIKEAFDYRTDSPLVSKPLTAEKNAILLMDGVFLLRPELNPYWDLRIFLHVPFEIVIERAKVRDAAYLGGEQQVEEKYLKRYIPGQKMYLDLVHPEEIADIVIDNTDFNNPSMDINKAILVTKSGSELTDNELNQISASLFREFNVPPPTKDYLQDKLFFLLKNGDEILAMGALWEVYPVLFNKETFTMYGFLEVIANIKAKGYGKRVVVAMREHLVARNKTAFGFTMPKNIGFYEKCGFKIETESTQRFVYTKDGERITNQDGQVIFYQDSSDKLMEKILANKDLEVSIPTGGLW